MFWDLHCFSYMYNKGDIYCYADDPCLKYERIKNKIAARKNCSL